MDSNIPANFLESLKADIMIQLKSVSKDVERISNEVEKKIDEFKRDVEKRFDQLFSAYNQNKSDIDKLLTHTEYTKEKFEEMRGLVDREVSLVWKAFDDQKSECIKDINTAVGSVRTEYKNDLVAFKEFCGTTREAAIQKTQSDIENTKNHLQLKWWHAIAVALLSIGSSVLVTYLVQLIRHGTGN
jgi:ElaB/YqjD/DUF883 family membrane-anchored ribosome-binding protein